MTSTATKCGHTYSTGSSRAGKPRAEQFTTRGTMGATVSWRAKVYVSGAYTTHGPVDVTDEQHVTCSTEQREQVG
jgi:hypothetical protein